MDSLQFSFGTEPIILTGRPHNHLQNIRGGRIGEHPLRCVDVESRSVVVGVGKRVGGENLEWSRRSTEKGEEWRGDGEEGEDGEGDERVRVRRDEHTVVVVSVRDSVADGGEDHFGEYLSKGEGRNRKYDNKKYHLIFIFESPRVDKHV